jgi:hypothetical protein
MDFLKKIHNKLTAPDSNLELRLTNWSVVAGQNLDGSLILSSKEDFDCTEVRCEINCAETTRVIRYTYDPAVKRSLPHEVMETAVVCSLKPILNGSTHFYNGENRNYPINVAIPHGGLFTNHGSDRKVVWSIKGVVAVDGRPDITTNTAEFQVIQPTAPINQPAMVKEVIREVVKIPCRYCQTLFDQLDTSCPNCGAKRTI